MGVGMSAGKERRERTVDFAIDNIVIDVTGQVRAVAVEHPETLSLAVVDCTRERIRSWVFPMEGATENANVRFSVVFSHA